MFDSLAMFFINNVAPTVSRAIVLRKELLDSGVIDIVLLCLAQQAPRCASLRPEDGSASTSSSADALAKFSRPFIPSADGKKNLDDSAREYIGRATRSRTKADRDASVELSLPELLEHAKWALDAVKERIPSQKEAKDATKTVGAASAIPEKTPTELYLEVLGPIQFDSMSFFEDDGKTNRFPYHYMKLLNDAGSTTNLAKRTRRLAQELVTLQTSLPLTLGSSVFLRASEERLDVMKVLITGPARTPYSNGCFEFDVHFPTNYPETPMLVNLSTTGNGRVQFNPNLYESGKVCLSLLNTWDGRPEERWSSTSSLLQALVSVQSLIFVEEPFYNEPGYEALRGLPKTDAESRSYNSDIQSECVRWAMLEQLRSPPKAFADTWIVDLKHYIKNTSDIYTCECKDNLASLEEYFKELTAEMCKMEAPEGLENVRSKHLVKPEAVGLLDSQQPGPSGLQRAGIAPSTSKAMDKTVAC